MVYCLTVRWKVIFLIYPSKKVEMLTHNPFFTTIYSNINNLESKIASSAKRWKIKPEDMNWVKGSAKGIFGKMFEIVFEYIITIKRVVNMSKEYELIILKSFISNYRTQYNEVVPKKEQTFKNIDVLLKQSSADKLFVSFIIMAFEISYWYYYNINLDPSSSSSLKTRKCTVHQGVRDSVKYTFKNVKHYLETESNVVHSIKDFFFNFFKLHNADFSDLINLDYTIKFNWNYRTWNEQVQKTNAIHEFDISVFEIDEEGNLKRLIHVYELKFSERQPMVRIQDVKKNSTDGPIKIYLKFKPEFFEADFIKPVYTILVFTTGEVISI